MTLQRMSFTELSAAERRREVRNRHEFWRMQLLDELHGRLEAIAYEPALDPRGRRRAALASLIHRFEEIEREEIFERARAKDG